MLPPQTIQNLKDSGLIAFFFFHIFTLMIVTLSAHYPEILVFLYITRKSQKVKRPVSLGSTRHKRSIAHPKAWQMRKKPSATQPWAVPGSTWYTLRSSWVSSAPRELKEPITRVLPPRGAPRGPAPPGPYRSSRPHLAQELKPI